jgi:hypothetical protein
MAKKIVVVEVEDRNPFAGEDDVADLDSGTPRDVLFVPGYSDKRIAYDAAVARGEHPEPLDYRLQWVKAQKSNGDRDGTKIAEWKSKRYRMLTWDEVKRRGINIEDSAAHKGENGTVQNGDLVLMIADSNVAAMHWRQNREAIDSQFQERVYTPLQESAEAFNRKYGYTEKTGTAFELESEPVAKKKK